MTSFSSNIIPGDSVIADVRLAEDSMDAESESELTRKLAVWSRIEDGTANAEDHALALKWGQEHYEKALQDATRLEKWMMTRGQEIAKAWPFPIALNQDNDIQSNEIYLFAILYGDSDIRNGGLDQFFGNSTGDFAPEFRDGLALVGETVAAGIIQKSLDLYGDPFPRNAEERRKYTHLQPQLDKLDDKYYAALEDRNSFEARCETLIKY